MEAISSIVKVSLPKYLSSLPIPESFGGIFKLTGGDVISLTPFVVTVSVLGYALFRLAVPAKSKPPQINKDIKKDNPKVVDLVEIEDMEKDKMSYCRCWKSSKFPLCDGTHNKHNEETGDNLGPVVIRRPAKAK